MHYAEVVMSKLLQIRNLPDPIYERLALRAEREGRSLNQQAIIELQRRFSEETGGERRQQVLDSIREDLTAGRGRKLSPPPELLVRQDRER
jgi:plasmid stability protein